MPAKPVKLRAVRAQRQRGKRSQIVRDMKSAALGRTARECQGYVLVTWEDDWTAHTNWWSGETMPGRVVPEFVKQSLLAAMHIRDIDDASED